MKTKRKGCLFALLLAALILFASLPGSAEEQSEEEPEIGAEQAVIFNADDGGEILYGKNETQPVYCGFLPRVMTCILIMESGRNLEETVTVTKEMLTNTPQISSAQLSAGDQVSWKDLIACITVVNSQEAAVAAAMTLGGTLPDFVEKMNSRAKELGATETVFTNVTGSYTSNTKQISTLADCAKILSAALQYSEIADPATQRTLQITVNGKTKTLYTRNMLIETMNGNYNSAAKGLFIYSESDSNSSIATYRKDSDRKIISMAVTTKGLGALYQDAGVLLKYSQNRYVSKTLLPAGKALTEVTVKYGKDVDFAVLVSAAEVTALVPKIYGEETAELILDVPENLEAPIEKGSIVGKVTVLCGGKEYGTVDLKVQSQVEIDYFELYSSKIAAFFSSLWLWAILGGLTILVLGYVLLTYRLNHPRKKKSPARDTGGRIRMTKSDSEED